MTENLLFVFDKDGVLFDTELLKTHVFEEVFAMYPQHAKEIHDYMIADIGTPRKVKFEYICKEILKLDNVALAVQSFVHKSKEDLKQKLLTIPPMKGLIEFLQRFPKTPKYVCSMAPQEEVKHQIHHHGLEHFFEELYGFPTPKKTVIEGLKEKYGKNIVFFGDTIYDYQVAKETSVAFVGVQTSPFGQPFRNLSVPVIRGFDEMDLAFFQNMEVPAS